MRQPVKQQLQVFRYQYSTTKYTWFTPSILASLAFVEGLVKLILFNVWSPQTAYLEVTTGQINLYLTLIYQRQILS